MNASATCSRGNCYGFMRPLLSESNLRILTPIMALAILIGSVPLTSGVVVVSGLSRPELTVSICHPLQVFDQASNPLLARGTATRNEFALYDLGSAPQQGAPRRVECSIAPDTPPPKRFV